jgi:hypothetical protein
MGFIAGCIVNFQESEHFFKAANYYSLSLSTLLPYVCNVLIVNNSLTYEPEEHSLWADRSHWLQFPCFTHFTSVDENRKL